MKITVIRCEKCRTLLEPQESVPFEEKRYITLDMLHLCISCAMAITVFDFIKTIAVPLARDPEGFGRARIGNRDFQIDTTNLGGPR